MYEELIDINKLRERVPLGKSTIYTLVENNEIPHYRIGRRILFRWEDIERWLQQQSNGGETSPDVTEA